MKGAGPRRTTAWTLIALFAELNIPFSCFSGWPRHILLHQGRTQFLIKYDHERQMGETKRSLWGFNTSSSWAVEVTLNITGSVLRRWFCSSWAFSSYAKHLAGCSSSLTCLLLWLSVCTGKNDWALLRDPQLNILPCPSPQSTHVMVKGRQWTSEKLHPVFSFLAFQLLFDFPFLCTLYWRPVSKAGSVFSKSMPGGPCEVLCSIFMVFPLQMFLNQNVGSPHPKLSYLCLLCKNIY